MSRPEFQEAVTPTRATVLARVASGDAVRSVEPLIAEHGWSSRGWCNRSDGPRRFWTVVLDDLGGTNDELLGAAVIEDRPDGSAWLVAFAVRAPGPGALASRLLAAVVDRVRATGRDQLRIDLD